MQKELIKKIKSFKTDEEVRSFLEIYLRLYKNKSDSVSKNSNAISQMFKNCTSLTSVDFSSLTSIL